MQLSPSVRTVLTAVAAVVAALAVAIPTLGAPVWVGVILGVVTTALAALGIVPPQTGGTQVGVASPAVVNQPLLDEPAPAPVEALNGISDARERGV